MHAIQIDSNRFGEHRRSYYSSTWQPLPVRYVKPPMLQDAPKPQRLEEMVAVAEAIGRDLDHVRVDMYVLPDRIVIGELTIYHNAGCSAYDPESFDLALGDAWTLPTDQPPPPAPRQPAQRPTAIQSRPVADC